VVDSYFPGAGIEYYHYDQLGSWYSDQPTDSTLWDLPRFVEEVEQVRQALKLDSTNFFLLGQSWGGMLAIEYALKYQQHLKGLIISNMMSSMPAYNEYAEKVLMPAMDQKVLAEVKALEAKKDYANPRYMELADSASLRGARAAHSARPVARSGEPRVQAPESSGLHPDAGPSELGASGKAGPLGPEQRPGPDHGVHAGHRRGARHDGPEAHGVDVEADPQGRVFCSVRMGSSRAI
jgi:proline iminopeptidase